MGLSKDSMGLKAMDLGLVIQKKHADDKVIALGGNPNVGKSTVFNRLTGLRQHTGNWPGKTVTNAQGYCEYHQNGYAIVDLPGCYSLMAHSVEEEVARDFICFGGADTVIIVCDATCMERSLNLVLQTLEITSSVVVCINLLDEAKKNKIRIDLETLSKRLGVPVVGTAARTGQGLDRLMEAVEQVLQKPPATPLRITYPEHLEAALSNLEPEVEPYSEGVISSRWISLMLLHGDQRMHAFMEQNLGRDFLLEERVSQCLREEKEWLTRQGVTEKQIKDEIVSAIVHTSDDLCREVVVTLPGKYAGRNSKLDSILTGKWTAFPIMVLALLGIFWITISGANYPSQLLADGLFWLGDQLQVFLLWIQIPAFLTDMLVSGVYRVLAWVVSVMLPPMAIFFPLFTLLEDVGILPRVAFNLDKCFKKCCACGKQALTMCVGNLCYKEKRPQSAGFYIIKE